MSPYAEFPKSNRVSMEWGRETIEMQENGSTKNLLQMTDIYYSVCVHMDLSFELLCLASRDLIDHLYCIVKTRAEPWHLCRHCEFESVS